MSWRTWEWSRPSSSRPHPSLKGRTRWRTRGSTAKAASANTSQSIEVAAVRDALQFASGRLPRIFTIRPGHNPLGPFDFGGEYDDRSDRRQPLSELIARGYEDAYRQFIEPVVGASGERVGR